MSIIVNGIYGWLFSAEDIERANRDGSLLTLDYELGDACRLRCIYCYRSYDSRDIAALEHRKKPLLNKTEWRRVVDEAKELGVKSIKLIGGGEITEEKDFIPCMEYIADSGIIPVLFTAGTVLGDDDFCRRIHGIDSKALAIWLHEKIGASVFIKMDALSSALQDEIAGMPGYSLIRDRAYQLLKDVGFNKHSPTRLGLEVNIGRRNVHEIMDIYALRIKDNVYEDVVTSMPCDTYFRNKDYDISLEEKRDLYQKIYSFNKVHGIAFEHISPFMGGLECTQLGNGLYVTNKGDVYHCPASFEVIGNTKVESLKSIWARFSEARKYQAHYFCPFREQAEIVPSGLVRDLECELVADR